MSAALGAAVLPGEPRSPLKREEPLKLDLFLPAVGFPRDEQFLEVCASCPHDAFGRYGIG
jgi:hypothetical protein